MTENDNFAFLLPVITAIFGAIFVVVARWGTRCARSWSCGFFLIAAAFCAPLAHGLLPIEAVALTADGLFLAGFYFYGDAILIRFARPRLRLFRLLLCVVIFAVLAWCVLVWQSLHAELTVGDLASALLMGIAVFSSRRSARHAIDRMLLLVAATVVVETLVRVTLLQVMGGAGQGLESYLTSRYAFILQTVASVVGLLLALTALAAATFDVIERYRRAAEQDPLTGLLNRRGFESAVPPFDPAVSARGAVMTCDIDHFKRVNDAYGHAAGDLVIVALARLLKSHLPGASVARFGGEEFVAYLPDHTLAEAGLLANAIRQAFAARDWREIGVGQQITASFGIAAPLSGDQSLQDAVSRADAGLYAAKAAGRNKVMPDGRPPFDLAGPRIISVA